MSKDAEQHKKRRAERRAKAIELLGGECANCGSTDRLEFDHIDNDRKGLSGLISQLTSYTWERLLDELEKCQLLCKSCHTQKSILDHGKKEARHGVLSMYKNQRRRCLDCRTANANYMRQYKIERAV